MKLVIDANILIAALLRRSTTRELIMSGEFELICPDFLSEEVEKHSAYIAEKAGLSNSEVELLLALLLRRVTTVPSSEYESRISEASGIIENDPNDLPYVACYLATNSDGIWTNDRDFVEKEQMAIFTTERLLQLRKEK